MTLKLVSAIEPAPAGLYHEGPTPWRTVNGYSELSAILDARGRTLFVCRRELAGRIVAAVNLVEGGHDGGGR